MTHAPVAPRGLGWLFELRGFLHISALLAIAWSIFHVYSAAFGAPDSMVFRPVHVAMGTAVVFATAPMLRRWQKKGVAPDEAMDEMSIQSECDKRPEPVWMTALDLLLVMASLGIAAFYWLEAGRITTRVQFVDSILVVDVLVGIGITILVLEACRRIAGLSLSLLVLIFLAYQAWGNHLPGLLYHQGLSLERFVELQFLTLQGMFSTPVGVSADYVFYFVLFAAFLEVSGGGRLFINIALALTGRFRGGPAKAAIVGSALMGSVNGSSVANVASTGVFTIPLMKHIGFKARFAAAVEAMASTGGQILPPIMGAGAFIMAQMIGMPYHEVIVAAIIPAVLYFVSAFFMVNKQSAKDGIQATPKDERVGLREIITRIHLLAPFLYLVYMVLSGRSLMSAAFESIVVALVVGFLHRATWFTPYAVLKALENGARRAVSVALPCAAAGIVVGVIIQTNIGLRFTELIFALSGGHVGLALVLVAVVTIILGMGMPSTAAYIMAAVLTAPPLIEMGVAPLVAHMFIFYFSCLAMITPPVALSSFAAASIAGSPIARTGLTAFNISIAAYLVPFAFAFSPALLLEGTLGETVWYTSTALLGVYSLSAAVIGYQFRNLARMRRAAYALGAMGLIYPGYFMTGLMAASVAGLLAWDWSRRGRIPTKQRLMA
ncbi:TRAP transporter permease [Nesterenkonia populi]|uniref:TRAP transporter permease n=1 Tax=Nesterenkonia populi TaxID=1591087 RepID=UPI0011BFD1BF|nr:TRAP transporter fused permease subunit [Nesterenkonia populi]